MSNQDIQDEELITQIKALPKDFLEELKNEVRLNRQKENRKRRFLRRIVPLVAACILSVVSVSLFVDFPTYSKEYLASNKIQNDILLPDNSKIYLDANTTINVKYYKNKRVINLSNGKAIFEVTSNESQPFIVNTKRINVKVLGTKFEVINLEDKLQVNVLEGKVQVSKAQNDKELAIVTKGQSLQLDKNANLISQNSVNIEKMLEWKDGKYSFQQTSLNEVLNEFSKHLDINIVFEKEKAKLYPISGNFEVKHFDNFLKVLPMIHPVKVENKDNIIVIK
ncbi:FecR domain-containing protein [Aliarcobacter butzleri]|uniref:FecR family protein n=1 Tax=Aliarcobacter butzleri TaxID=28197 RepID=UPI00263D5F03|nr:FecR domain-containing protein [Aliarcobacter butzleri]MDN5109578.1 FecR domain-containing protein [Aliarcobacter butzleri]